MDMHSLPTDEIGFHFDVAGGLHRIFGSRRKPVLTRNGNALVTIFRGVLLTGPQIAWALRFGNWPKFPLVNLSGDPFDLRIGINIFPARFRALRPRVTQRGALFYHPLSTVGWSTQLAAKEDWQTCAASRYSQDMDAVLAIEKTERERRQQTERAAWEAENRARAADGRPLLPDPENSYFARQKALAPRSKYAGPLATLKRGRPVLNKDPKPTEEREGYVWYSHRGKWLLLPESCHVSDDIVRRAEAVQAGAVRFQYRPEGVQAFMPDGSEYRPAP